MIVCQEEGCTENARHLSTVDGHYFGPATDAGVRMWTETRQYKCPKGHLSKQGIWLAKDIHDQLFKRR